MMSGRKLRVAVVAPIMLRYDAISRAAYDTVQVLADDQCFDVQHFGTACDFPEIPHRSCGDVSQLLLDPLYQASDVVIFHFGIYHNLFNALLAGGPRVRIVHFHNVTPPHLVRTGEQEIIARSLRQIELLRYADEVWAVSATNAEELFGRGFDRSNIRVMPLVVDSPQMTMLAEKPAPPVEILYIGRIAFSKGLHDLIPAVAAAGFVPQTARLTITGNTTWADPAYVNRLRNLIARHGLERMVRFVGNVDDAEWERLFHAAHLLVMPSYHEGFCKPVPEGFRAGCIPIVYDAYNLPRITAGLGRVVPAGDIGRLGEALADFVRAIPRALSEPCAALLPLDRGSTSVEEFSTLARRQADKYGFAPISERTRNRVLSLAERTLGRSTLYHSYELVHE